MKEKDQIGHFDDDMDKLISRYTDEFDLSLASMIGVLMCKVYELITNSDNDEEDEEEE